MDSILRPEIIAAQESRANLFQHKLTVVAVLGAVGLGLDLGTAKDLTPVWALIPWVCIYIDLLTHQLDTRIFVIHHFLHGENRLRNLLGEKAYRPWDEGDYEHFARGARSMKAPRSSMNLRQSFGIQSDHNAFRFEGDLVDLTTIGIILMSIVGPFASSGPAGLSVDLIAFFAIFGLLALTLKLLLIRNFAVTRAALRDLENRWVASIRLPIQETQADAGQEKATPAVEAGSRPAEPRR
jgi:hypothetical protein